MPIISPKDHGARCPRHCDAPSPKVLNLDHAKASAAPLLMIQGGNDEQIPVASTQILATRLCNIGQNLVRWIYPGQSHAGVIGPSANDMIQWIANRFAGVANPDPYVPTGQNDIQTTSCPS